VTPEQRYRLKKPWIKYICWAKRRCTDTKSKWFRYYGAKGIKMLLNVDEAEFLWKRDNADKLVKPSLDRKKSHLNHTIENCRFIEFELNSRMGWDPKAHPDKDEDPGKREAHDHESGWDAEEDSKHE